MNKLLSYIKNPTWRRYINYAVVIAVAVVFGVMSITTKKATFQSTQYLLEKMAIAAILAVSLSMVVGFLGELSLGHAGFMCVGAFVGGKIATLLVPTLGGGNESSFLVLFISLLAGGACAALVGVLIGLPALRLRGDYLAIVTLAFGEIVRSLTLNLPAGLFGGTLGLETPRFSRKYLFIVALVVLLLSLAAIQNLIKSKHGRAIISIKDNEIAARAMGVDITKYKLFVFTVSSFFAGLAGVLYSYTQFRVQSATFDYNYSIEILVMVVLGGMGSINGSLAAAALITYLNVQLQTVLTGNMAVLQNLIYAVILIIIVVYKNAPGLKSVRERYNLKTLGGWLGKRLAKKPADETSEEVHGDGQ